MTHSILIMLYGQSNADAHNAGPSVLSPFLDNPNVVVPNDGRGFQGLRGRERTREITGFQPSYDAKGKIQSIGAALGCTLLAETTNPYTAKIIVRSAACGGRPLHGHFKQNRHLEGVHLDGYDQTSAIFTRFIEDIEQIAKAAAKDGYPLRHVYIPFFHGEADRAQPKEDYRAHLVALMDAADARLGALDLETDWLLTQPSGTTAGHTGNGWDNRLCLTDIAHTRPNAHLAAANYGYELDDSVHLSARSKALIGEALGHKIAMLERRKQPLLTQLSDITVMGRTVDLHFDGPHDITLDASRFPAPQTNLGFNIARQKGQLIERVTQLTPRSIRLDCALPLDGHKTSIDYAFIKTVSDPDARPCAVPFAVGRGCLREDWLLPSRIFPGVDIASWVPGFSVALRDVAAVAQAA